MLLNAARTEAKSSAQESLSVSKAKMPFFPVIPSTQLKSVLSERINYCQEKYPTSWHKLPFITREQGKSPQDMQTLLFPNSQCIPPVCPSHLVLCQWTTTFPLHLQAPFLPPPPIFPFFFPFFSTHLFTPYWQSPPKTLTCIIMGKTTQYFISQFSLQSLLQFLFLLCALNVIFNASSSSQLPFWSPQLGPPFVHRNHFQ